MIPKNNEIRFEISTVCNYECIMCARDKLRRKKEIMPTDKFRYYLDKIIGESDQYQVLSFPGLGEPLLDPEFKEKAIIARDRGLKLLLLTNGSKLSVQLFKELADIGFESIRVSFYGFNFTTYNKVHGLSNGNYFQMIKENLTEICSIKKDAKILMTYNVIPDINDSDVDRWISYWEPLADLVEVWRPHNWVYGRSYREVQSQLKRTCGRPWTTPLQIQVDGTINMCCFDFNGDLTLGDLNNQTLSEVFESEMFKKILKCHKSGDFEGSNLICENCDQRNKDKSNILIYNSKFDKEERIRQFSTTYSKVLKD